jgi:uncharacterized membrane protein YfcA
VWVVAAFALAGGLAQFIDGTLGMGFGVTSATVLLFIGVSPVTASAATHAAQETAYRSRSCSASPDRER